MKRSAFVVVVDTLVTNSGVPDCRAGVQSLHYWGMGVVNIQMLSLLRSERPSYFGAGGLF